MQQVFATSNEPFASSSIITTSTPLLAAAAEHALPPSATSKRTFDATVAQDQTRLDFYVAVIETLQEANIPFLLGGAYAYECYTGVHRDTKDLDVFLLPEDIHRALAALSQKGYTTELSFAYWLGKVKNHSHPVATNNINNSITSSSDASSSSTSSAADFVDFIFNSANGVCPVSQDWFIYATETTAFGKRVLLVPVEEMVWQKAFIMEKERFDGNDITHLILTHGGTTSEDVSSSSGSGTNSGSTSNGGIIIGKALNWERLVNLFGKYWRVLFTHIMLFGFVYPRDQIQCVPRWVYQLFLERFKEELELEQFVQDLESVSEFTRGSTSGSSSGTTSASIASAATTSSSPMVATLVKEEEEEAKNRIMAPLSTPLSRPKLPRGTPLIKQAVKQVEEWKRKKSLQKEEQVSILQGKEVQTIIPINKMNNKQLLLTACESGSTVNSENKECRGTLLSRAQYLTDIFRWGYEDARRTHEHMTDAQISKWTRSIQEMHVADAALVRYFEQHRENDDNV